MMSSYWQNYYFWLNYSFKAPSHVRDRNRPFLFPHLIDNSLNLSLNPQLLRASLKRNIRSQPNVSLLNESLSVMRERDMCQMGVWFTAPLWCCNPTLNLQKPNKTIIWQQNTTSTQPQRVWEREIEKHYMDYGDWKEFQEFTPPTHINQILTEKDSRQDCNAVILQHIPTILTADRASASPCHLYISLMTC